jgi:uncharacterized protein (DUF1919 family)
MNTEPWPSAPDHDIASSALEAPPILIPDSKAVRVRLAGAASTAGAIPIDADVRLTGLNTDDIAGQIPEENLRTWKHSLRDVRNRFGVLVNRVGLENEKFTVLSNDCWGQALYAGYGLPYQTPLVGSGMYSDCFLRFLGDVEGYLRSPLRFVSQTRYAGLQRIRNQRRAWPIAVLRDDVEIHFMHYQSEYTSRRAWEAGLENMHLDRIAVKFTADKDGATEEQVRQFAALPFRRKLLLIRRSRPEIACAVQTPDFVINGAVMFRRSLKYFDCTRWLNTGEIAVDTPRVWVNKLIYARGA